MEEDLGSPTTENKNMIKEKKVSAKNTNIVKKKKKKPCSLPLDLSTKSVKHKLLSSLTSPIIPSASMGNTSSNQILSLFTQTMNKDDGKHFLFMMN